MFSITSRSLVLSSLKNFSRCISSLETEFLVINAVGPDRPGIVSEITKLVVEEGGNVGESQASRLGSHFGLMMLIEIPKMKSDALQSRVQLMSDMSTSCYITSNPDKVKVTPRDGYSGQFVLHGADNHGIVHEVTKVLAKHRLNIDELKTFEDKSQPYGGVSLFHMSGIATSPAPLAKNFDSKSIREELEALGDQMNCDITLEDVNDEKYNASFYAG